MNQNRFFIPNMAINQPMMNSNYILPRNMGFFQKITNSIHSFNWSKLLEGTNKTLNIMNQAIPLIRQTKPMINNVKSMINIAKALKKETKIQPKHQMNNNKIYDTNNEYPNFFI